MVWGIPDKATPWQLLLVSAENWSWCYKSHLELPIYLTGYECSNVQLLLCDVRCFQSFAAGFCVWILRQQFFSFTPLDCSLKFCLAILFLYDFHKICVFMNGYLYRSSANKSFVFIIFIFIHFIHLVLEWDWWGKYVLESDWFTDWLVGFLLSNLLRLKMAVSV